MCRNESVDTNWFIFRHARRLRNSVWASANSAQTNAVVKQFVTICTLEQPATILRKSVHALNQFCKNDSSGKTWLRFWNCSILHECVLLETLNHVVSRWVRLWQIATCFASCACWAECPWRLINVWQSFGKDCQSCADCTTWKTWNSWVIVCRIDPIWRTAPLVLLTLWNVEHCITLWHCGTSPKYVQYLGNTLHLAQIAPRLINVWHGEAPCANVGHVGYVDVS